MSKKEFYQQEKDTLLSEFSSSKDGLSTAAAQKNLEQFGKNELAAAKKKSMLRIFLEQFADFLVIILIIAATISAILGDAESSVVIFVVITINAILGTVQTIKAEQSLDSLKKLSAPTAKVLRDGTVVMIPSAEVAIGDVVLLEAGDYVCADGRILENASLKINESALTGESVSVDKVDAVIEGDVALGDRTNMVFSGSFVTYGRGQFLVTGTGMQTEMGKIATLLGSTKEKKTPLQVTLDSFGKKLSIIILAICAILFAVSVFRGEELINAFMFAVALAVAAIPEALSSIVTIVLSFGTQKMAKEQAIIRKLQAVEGLGSVSIICSDKTGTLTQNKMTVKQYYVSGEIISADAFAVGRTADKGLMLSALLCSDATIDGENEIGDPTETALLRFGENYAYDAGALRSTYARLGEIPFDSDRKLMSTVQQIDGELTMFTKGAVDVLTDRMILSEEEREAILSAGEHFSREGLRVLCFAGKTIDHTDLTLDDENELTFLGLIAMMDPPREESKQAVADCIAAGIKPIMITGDHKVTAAAIAKQIGILNHENEAVEGSEIDGMTDEELQAFVPKISVYARVSPEHKIRIVRAWQDLGNIVAMTGDGVNDAPALKQADIGVAMGITGTEVSKDAAGMVLSDDNFATIVKAVKNGRNVYANIKRSIQFLLSGNTAGIFAVLYASLAALPVPFAPVHLLFINLLTDSLPAIALGLEPHSSDVMKEKPRPRDEGILTGRFLVNILIEGIVITLATLTAFHIGLQVNAATGSTMAFATLCFSRLVHGYNCKADRPLLFTKRFWNNVYLHGAFIIGTLLLAAVLLIAPLSEIFKVAPLSGIQLLWIAGLGVGAMLVNQLIKTIRIAITNRK